MTALGSPPSSAPPQPLDPRRRLDALSNAVGAELTRAERPGFRIGVVLVVGVAIILGLLGRAVPALAWLNQLPTWLPTVLIVAACAVVVAAMPILMLPRRTLDAWIAYAFLAQEGNDEWRRRTGQPYPETAAAAERWLAQDRDPDAHGLQRATLLLTLGRPREASEILATGVPSDQAASFLYAQLAWLAAFMTDRDDPVLRERCREVAAGFPAAGRERRVADASVEMLTAVRALVLEMDWTEPLVRARRALGDLARGMAFRRLFLPRLRHYATISAAVGAVVIGVQLYFGAA